MGGKSATKSAYFDKLRTLLDKYKSIFIVTVDNVASQQMHEIRQTMRGESVVLMGKNTMVRTGLSIFQLAMFSWFLQVRRAIKGFLTDNPEYERLLPHVKGTFGATIR